MSETSETAAVPHSGFRYWAFISYSHADSRHAADLHRRLERFRVPSRLVGRETTRGKLPARLQPIFRDREELPTSADLGGNLRAALTQSRLLIVLCSPNSARSRWVNEEVIEFKRQGRDGSILCLIIAGEPNATDKDRAGDECFCPALRHALAADGTTTGPRVEPIAADMRAGRDGRNAAVLKLAAGILSVGYDELRQRHRRAALARTVQWAAAASVAAALAGTVAWQLDKQRRAEAWERARFEAEVATRQVEALIERGENLPALVAAVAALPRGLDRPDRPVVARLLSQLQQIRQRFPATLTMHRAPDSGFPPAAMLVTADRLVEQDPATNALRLWNTGSGRMIAVLRDVGGARTNFARLSDDGGILAFWPRTQEARWTWGVWRMADGAAIDLPELTDGLTALPFGPRGLIAYGVRQSGAINVYDVYAGRMVLKIDGPPGARFDAGAFDPAGTRIAAAFSDAAQIEVWDLNAARRIAVLAGHAGAIRILQFVGAGEHVTAIAADNTVWLWETSSGRVLTTIGPFDGDARSPRDVAVSMAARRMVIEHRDGKTSIWSLDTGQPVTAGWTVAEAEKATLLPDGRRVLLAPSGGTVRVADIADGRTLATLEHGPLRLEGVALSGDGRFASVLESAPPAMPPAERARWPAEAALYDTSTGARVFGWPETVHLGPAGASPQRIAGVSRLPSGVLTVFEGLAARLPAELAGGFGQGILSADGTTVLLLRYSGEHALIRVGDWGTARTFGVPSPDFNFLGGTLAADGSAALIWHRRRFSVFDLPFWHRDVLRLWKLGASPEALELTGHAAPIGDGMLAVAANRALTLPLAALRSTHPAILWDTATGTILRRYDTGIFGGALLSADGRLVVTWWSPIGLDPPPSEEEKRRRVRPAVHDAATGALRFELDADDVRRAAIDPKAERIAVVDATQLRLFRARDGALLHRIPIAGTTPEKIAFSDDGALILSVGATLEADETWNGRLTLYAVAEGTLRREIVLAGRRVEAARFDRPGRRLVIVDSEWSAHVYDVATGLRLATVRSLRPDEPYRVPITAEFTPDGRALLIAPQGKPLRLVPLDLPDASEALAWARRVVDVNAAIRAQVTR